MLNESLLVHYRYPFFDDPTHFMTGHIISNKKKIYKKSVIYLQRVSNLI